jgi:hypothetical protein
MSYKTFRNLKIFERTRSGWSWTNQRNLTQCKVTRVVCEGGCTALMRKPTLT